MVEVEYFVHEQGKNEGKVAESFEKSPAARKLQRKSLGGSNISTFAIKAFFSYVYALFFCVYILGYTQSLKNAYEEGFDLFIKSKAFWNFQRDIIIGIIGFFILMLSLKVMCRR